MEKYAAPRKSVHTTRAFPRFVFKSELQVIAMVFYVIEQHKAEHMGEEMDICSEILYMNPAAGSTL